MTAPMQRASGTFDVKITPQPSGESHARMSLDKTFHGDLEATSIGEMLAVRTAVEGSAGYVAIERVTGTLAGRRGTFHLQHSGTMSRGTQHLELNVIPDSGTGELAGLSGKMTIDIRDGKHYYAFEYALPVSDSGTSH